MDRIGRLRVLDTRIVTKYQRQNKKIPVINLMNILTLNIGYLAHLHIDSNVDYLKTVSPKVDNLRSHQTYDNSDNTSEVSCISECDVLLVVSKYCFNLKTLSLSIGFNHPSLKLLLPESFPSNLCSLSLNCGDHLESDRRLINLLENTKSLQILNFKLLIILI